MNFLSMTAAAAVFAVAAFSQTASFPSAVVTDQQLKVVANNCQTTITFPVGVSDTTINVANGACIPSNSIVTLDNENIAVCASSSNQLTVGTTSCPNVAGRGYDGTTAAAHSATGANCNPGTASGCASLYIDAWHHNATRVEVEAIENALGANLSNITVANPLPQNKGGSGTNSPLSGILLGNGTSPFTTLPCTAGQYARAVPQAGAVTYTCASPTTLISADYAFAVQSPGGSLAVGNNTVTLSPVPFGVNGTDTNHSLLVSGGTGTTEACKINGGTAASGATSGTVILNCAGTHSGAWTVQSATAGTEEALLVATAGGNPVPPGVRIPGGSYSYYGTLYVPATKDLRIDSDNAVISWPSGISYDAILIDSCEDCDYRFPLMIYEGSGNAVHVMPANADPSGLTALEDSRIWVTDIGIGSAMYFGVGNALVDFDVSAGIIADDDFFVGGAGGAKHGVLVSGTANPFTHNRITVSHMHDCTVDQVNDGTASSKNYWNISVASTDTAGEVGAVIGGTLSEWHIAATAFATVGDGVVIGSTAADNLLFFRGIDSGYTNNSALLNRIFSEETSSSGNYFGFNVTTPAIPSSGTIASNTNPTPVIASFLTAGTTASYLIYDQYGNGMTTNMTIAQGTQVFLNPGEGMKLNYSVAPTWQWRAVP